MGRIRHAITIAAGTMLLFGIAGSCGNKGGKLSTISISPAETTIARGTTYQFNATATFSDGTTINWNSAAAWSSSDDTSVTVSNAVGSYGLASSLAGGATGTVIITATDVVNNISGSAQVVVAEPLSITVNPPFPFMAVRTSHQFNATAILADLASGASSTVSVDLTSSPTISWFSNDTGVASVSTTGLVTAGTKTGPAVITAQYLYSSGTGSAGSTTVTVTDFAIDALNVDPSTPSLTPGASSPLQAVGIVTSPSLTYNYTESVNWSSADQTIATVSNDPGTKGLVTAGTGTGTATINIIDPITGKSGSAVLTVQ